MSFGQRAFPVLYDCRGGEFFPFTPSRIQRIHEAYGGLTMRLPGNPNRLSGFISRRDGVVICDTYTPGVNPLRIKQFGEARSQIVVPVDFFRQEVHRKWPALIRHRGDLWIAKMEDIPGVIGNSRNVLQEAKRRWFEFSFIPSVGAASKERRFEAVVVGNFPTNVLFRVLEAYHTELHWDWKRLPDGSGKCEFWNRFGVYPLDDAFYCVRRGICIARIPFEELLERETVKVVVRGKARMFDVNHCPDVDCGITFLAPHIYVIQKPRKEILCAYYWINGQLISVAVEPQGAEWEIAARRLSTLDTLLRAHADARVEVLSAVLH